LIFLNETRILPTSRAGPGKRRERRNPSPTLFSLKERKKSARVGSTITRRATSDARRLKLGWLSMDSSGDGKEVG
jgi:hypothetical protein